MISSWLCDMCEIRNQECFQLSNWNMALPPTEMGTIEGGSSVKYVNIKISLRHIHAWAFRREV